MRHTLHYAAIALFIFSLISCGNHNSGINQSAHPIDNDNFQGIIKDTNDKNKEIWLNKLKEEGIKAGCTKSDILAALNRYRSNTYFQDDRDFSIYEELHGCYKIDEEKKLHIIYKSANKHILPYSPQAEVKSVEVIGFTDLKNEIGEEIFPFVKLVHESPKIWGGGFDPIPLIRAVNGLYSLGKEQSLNVLKVYHNLSVSSIHKQMIYNLDEEKIFLILRLLFVRKDGLSQMPNLYIGAPDVMPAENDTNWPIFPLTLQGDIPYLLVNGYMLAGVPESPLNHIEYCEKYCDIRMQPLQPDNNPLLVLDELIKSQHWVQLLGKTNRDWHQAMMRSQALRAVRTVYYLKEDDIYKLYTCVRHNIDGDKAWQAHLDNFIKLNVRWDSRTNDYQLGQ